MPTFKYVAKRGPKELVEGVLEADDRAHVLSHLSGLGYIPVRISEAAPTSVGVGAVRPPVAVEAGGCVPVRHLNQFTRQFASLMRSHVPLLRALSVLKEQTTHPRLRQVLAGLVEAIRQGETLSSALLRYPRVFSPLYVSLTRSGEVSGTLDEVLDRLAAQADRDETMRAQVQSALAYPTLVGVVGIGTVIFLLTFVMPRLLKLFEGFGSRLPLPTRILLTVTGWCQQGWFWIGCLVAAGLLALWIRSRAEPSRLLWDRLSLRLPLLGTLTRDVELARFARSFGLLLDHGVPILQAAEVAIPVVHNRVIRRALERLPADLKEGGSLAGCLKTLPVATPFVVHTVAVGEEGGRVGEALAEIATLYEREVERLLRVMASLLEPMMILVVGSLVGFIVMAVLLPVFEMSVIAR